MWCTDEEERVAVGGHAHDGFGGDIAGGAWAIFNDELLTQPLRQPLAHQAREDVIGTSGREAHNYAHRPRWIGLRPTVARHGRQRRSARGQMQELSTGKLPWESPPGRSLPSASPGAYLSGMENDPQIRLLEEFERAWVKCLPGRQAAARNELMRALGAKIPRLRARSTGSARLAARPARQRTRSR